MIDQTAILSPMLAMFLLTFVVWIYMFARRIPWILANDLGPEQFRPLEFTRLQPPHVANPSDNLKNLFEMPVLFYALAIYLFVTQQVDQTYVTAAWVFAAFRVLHSLMHCTLNVVNVRFFLYAVSATALWFMMIRALLGHLLA